MLIADSSLTLHSISLFAHFSSSPSVSGPLPIGLSHHRGRWSEVFRRKRLPSIHWPAVHTQTCWLPAENQARQDKKSALSSFCPPPDITTINNTGHSRTLWSLFFPCDHTCYFISHSVLSRQHFPYIRCDFSLCWLCCSAFFLYQDAILQRPSPSLIFLSLSALYISFFLLSPAHLLLCAQTQTIKRTFRHPFPSAPRQPPPRCLQPILEAQS